MQTAMVLLVSGVVGLFGVTSAVLGFMAEAKRLTRDETYVSGRECVYPANPAHTLGICATFLLAVAQTIASAARGACCCRRPPPGAASSYYTTRRLVVGVIASVLSWVAAVIAVVLYWVGVTLNAPTTREGNFEAPNEECYSRNGGVFVRAAVLSLVATALGIMSCVLLRLPAAKATPEQGQHAVGCRSGPLRGTGKRKHIGALLRKGTAAKHQTRISLLPLSRVKSKGEATLAFPGARAHHGKMEVSTSNF